MHLSAIQWIVVAVVGTWAIAVTLVLLTLVRQVSLISVRLDLKMRLSDLSDVGVGPDLGMPVESQSAAMPVGEYVMVGLTGTCNSCVEFAKSLPAEGPPPGPPVVVLAAGSKASATRISRLLPEWVTVVTEPSATQIGRDLGLSRTTGALHVSNGVLLGRADVGSFEDLMALTNTDGSTHVHAPA
ncbi:MAG: hypothetical protein AAB131_03900 [Actinomycetota bacterium]